MEIFDKSQMSRSLLYYTKIVFPLEAPSQSLRNADLHLKRGRLEWTKRPVADNQYKPMFTLFTIGYSGVSWVQWLRSLV